jgi:hypothetical protein
MTGLPSWFHEGVAFLGAVTAGVVATVIVKIYEFVQSKRDPHDGSAIPRRDSAASHHETELERHRGWSAKRVAGLVLLLGLSIAVVNLGGTEGRLAVTAAFVALCAGIAALASHFLAEQYKKSALDAIFSLPMVAVLLFGGLSAYFGFPRTPDPVTTGATPPPPPLLVTPSASPEPNPATPEPSVSAIPTTPPDSETVSPGPTPSVESPIPPTAQPTTDTQRRVRINQMDADLKSNSPATRLDAFDRAMKSTDDALRYLALSTALKSPHPDLRIVALPAAVRSKKSFVVNITDSDHSDDSEKLLKLIGKEFTVQVEDFDPSSKTFRASTPASGGGATVGGPPFRRQPSTVSGERLSFSFSTGLVVPGGGCSGIALLYDRSATLRGSMNCSGNFTANYTITIDILK